MFKTFSKTFSIFQSIRSITKKSNTKIPINPAGIPNHDQLKVNTHGIRIESTEIHQTKIIRQDKVKQGETTPKSDEKKKDPKIDSIPKVDDYFAG